MPRDDLRHALTAVLPGLVADLADDTRNVLLTLARIASTLETDAIEPKDVAAERAARWLPADRRRSSCAPAMATSASPMTPGTSRTPRRRRGPPPMPFSAHRGPRRDIDLTRVRDSTCSALDERRTRHDGRIHDPTRRTTSCPTSDRACGSTVRPRRPPSFYTSLFPNSRIVREDRAASDFPGGHEGDLLTVDFELDGHPFTALNGGPDFRSTSRSRSRSRATDQAEIDRYWDALIADGGEPSACGWLKDRFGLSWQVYPIQLNEWLRDGDADAARRTMEAMLKMGKLDAAALQRAHDGV